MLRWRASRLAAIRSSGLQCEPAQRVKLRSKASGKSAHMLSTNELNRTSSSSAPPSVILPITNGCVLRHCPNERTVCMQHTHDVALQVGELAEAHERRAALDHRRLPAWHGLRACVCSNSRGHEKRRSEQRQSSRTRCGPAALARVEQPDEALREVEQQRQVDRCARQDSARVLRAAIHARDQSTNTHTQLSCCSKYAENRTSGRGL